MPTQPAPAEMGLLQAPVCNSAAPAGHAAELTYQLYGMYEDEAWLGLSPVRGCSEQSVFTSDGAPSYVAAEQQTRRTRA